MSRQSEIIEKAAFGDFKFELGQKVVHAATGELAVIISRTLLQAQTGNTGHLYTLSFGMTRRNRTMLEIELKAADD